MGLLGYPHSTVAASPRALEATHHFHEVSLVTWSALFGVGAVYPETCQLGGEMLWGPSWRLATSLVFCLQRGNSEGFLDTKWLCLEGALGGDCSRRLLDQGPVSCLGSWSSQCLSLEGLAGTSPLLSLPPDQGCLAFWTPPYHVSPRKSLEGWGLVTAEGATSDGSWAGQQGQWASHTLLPCSCGPCLPAAGAGGSRGFHGHGVCLGGQAGGSGPGRSSALLHDLGLRLGELKANQT